MINYRNLFTTSLLALAFILVFGACKKDGDTTPTPDNTGGATQQNAAFTRSMENTDILCFEFAFPLTVVLPDGSTQTANSDEELEGIFEDYYANNPVDSIGPMIQFPFSVTVESGETIVLENEQALYDLLDVCFDTEWNDCFAIQYPVTVVFPDGGTQVVNDDGELLSTVDAWYEANPGASGDPTVQFPIEVLTAEGELVTVNSEDEIDALFDECEGDDDWEICFEFVFPLTLALPDGTTHTVGSYEELDQFFMEWMENNPDSNQYVTLAYPMDVQLEGGEIVTLNSDEEMMALYEGCYGSGDDDDDWQDCFTFNYPVTIVFPDGTTQPVNDDEELYTVVDEWYLNNPDATDDPTLQFPLDVTTADGQMLTLNSEEELEALFEQCYECLVPSVGGLAAGGSQAALAKMVVEQHPKLQVAKQGRFAKAFAGGKDQ